jgi:acyl-homoserine lactone acylase PvdQ
LKTAEAVFLDESKEDKISAFWPTVWVKFGFLKIPFFFKRFELLNEKHRILPLETESSDRIVLRWSGFHLKNSDISPMFHFYKSKSVEEIDSYLKQVGVPSWNFVFADNKGDVGYRVIGNAYKILGNKSWGMDKKTSPEIEKNEFLLPDERPHLIKPSRGYIYTANNRHWPEDSLFHGGRGYTQSFRGYRIDEKLKGKQDLDSLKEVQCDNQVVDARFLIPLLEKQLQINELKDWSYHSDLNSIHPSLYRRTVDLILENWKVDEYALYRLLSSILDDNKKRELKEFYEVALKDTQGKTWGDFHRVNFPHMSQTSNWSFSPEISGIGDTHSVNPGTSKWNEEKMIYEQTAGASMRMIVEMSSPKPKIYLSLPGKNRNYATPSEQNPWVDWQKCVYKEVVY